jgi:hypothetical protein
MRASRSEDLEQEQVNRLKMRHRQIRQVLIAFRNVAPDQFAQSLHAHSQDFRCFGF